MRAFNNFVARHAERIVFVNIVAGLCVLAACALAACQSVACKPDASGDGWSVKYYSCVPVTCESCGPAIRRRST